MKAPDGVSDPATEVFQENYREMESFMSDPDKCRQMFDGETVEEYKSEPARARHSPFFPGDTKPGSMASVKYWGYKDFHAVVIGIILCIFGALLGIFCMPFNLIPMLMINAFTRRLARPTQTIPRTVGFRLLKIACFPFLIPFLTLFVLWPILVWILVAITSFPHVVLTLGFRRVYRNFSIIKRAGYLRTGTWTYDEMMSGMIGSIDRQGTWEYWSVFTWRIFVIPPIKYAILTNIWMMDLSMVYFNQWTAPIDSALCDEFDDKIIAAAAAALPLRALHGNEYRDIIDEQMFSVYYQMPRLEKFRKEKEKCCGATNRVNVNGETHIVSRIYNPDDICDGDIVEADVKTLQKPMLGIQTPENLLVLLTNTVVKAFTDTQSARSKLSKWSIFSVHLPYFFPYHHLTGLVEVNLTVKDEIEHPAWVFADRNSPVSMMSDMSDFFFEFGKQAGPMVKSYCEEFKAHGYSNAASAPHMLGDPQYA